MDHQQSYLSTTPGKVMLAVILLIIAIFIGYKYMAAHSFNNDRSKLADARAMSILSSSRSQAEVYSTSKGSYLGVCSDPDMQSLFTPPGRVPKITCNDSTDGFAAIAPLSTHEYYCVDSRGTATQINSNLADRQTTCPNY